MSFMHLYYVIVYKKDKGRRLIVFLKQFIAEHMDCLIIFIVLFTQVSLYILAVVHTYISDISVQIHVISDSYDESNVLP